MLKNLYIYKPTLIMGDEYADRNIHNNLIFVCKSYLIWIFRSPPRKITLEQLS